MTRATPIHNPHKAFVICWLIALLVVACAIRVQGVQSFHFHPEEMMHLHMAEGQDAGEVIRFSHYETHPPLGNLLRHVWLELSSGPDFVRSQSLCAGLALILIHFAIGLRLGGMVAGMAAAALAAFGEGTIEQSFTARNYSFFLVFLSGAFYSYLRWRETRSHASLWAYGICGMMAVLSHFSGIFGVGVIAVFEMAAAFKVYAPRTKQALWIAANAVIAMVAAYAYVQWRPVLQSTVKMNADHFSPAVLKDSLQFPIAVSRYLLPAGGLSVPLAALLLAAGGWSRMMLWLAMLLGMVLAGSGIYTETGRQSLWLFPFLAASLAQAFAVGCAHLRRRFAVLSAKAFVPFMATLMLLAGIFAYNPASRFANLHEYDVQESQWKPLLGYLESLRPDDVIITQRADGMLLTNLYPYFNDSAFTPDYRLTQVPYGQSEMIIDPFFPHTANPDSLTDIARHAEAQSLLKEKNRLVFFATRWSLDPMLDWIVCPHRNMQIVTFPSLPQPVTLGALSNVSVVLVRVPKDEFLHAAGVPDAQMQACLKRNNWREQP